MPRKVWKDIWSGTIGQRNVQVEQNAEGDWRVTTTLKQAVAAQVVPTNGPGVVQLPGRAAGAKITIDPSPGQSLHDALIADGDFAADEAAQICRAAGAT